MLQAAKLLRLATVTIALFLAGAISGLAQRPQELDVEPLNLYSKQSEATSESDGFIQRSLEEGDQVFSDTQRRFDAYGFDAQAGETIEITVTSTSFTPVISLINETTGELISRQTGEAGTVSLIHQLTQDGPYTFLVTATEMPGEGSYQFRIITIQETIGSQSEAGRLFDQGGQQYNRGQFEAAIASWEAALAIYQDSGDLDGQITTLSNLSVAHRGLGQYEQAIDVNYQRIAAINAIYESQGFSAALRRDEGLALGVIGILYRELGRYEDAIEVLEQGIAIAREVGDRSGEGSRLGNLALAYDGLGEHERAIELFEQRLVIARELNERDKESLTLGNLAETYISLGQIDLAIDALQQSLQIAQDIGFQEQEERIISKLDSISFRPNESDVVLLNAEGVLDESSEIFTLIFDGEIPDSNRLVNTHQIQGEANQTITIHIESNGFIPYLILVDLEEGSAIAKSLPALTLANDVWLIATLPTDGTYDIMVTTQEENAQGSYQLNVTQSETAELLLSDAATLSLQGSEQYQLGNYQEALSINEQALGFYRSEAVRSRFPEISTREEAVLLGDIANAYDGLGNYDQSIEFQQQSITLKRVLGNRHGEAFSLVNLGNTYRRAHNYESAIEVYEEALEIWRELDLSRKEEDTLDNLGHTALDWGLFDIAIEFYEQSLSIKRENNDQLGEASALISLGIAYYRSGKIDEAIGSHQESLTIARDLNDIDLEASALGNLANIYQTTGDLQLAINLKFQSLEIFRSADDLEGQAAVLNALGDIYSQAGLYQDSIDAYQSSLSIALEINSIAAEASTLNDLGALYSSIGRIEEAIELFDRSLFLSRESGDLHGEALALRNLAQVHRQNPVLFPDFHNQSVDIFRQLNNRSALARALGDLGDFYFNNPRILIEDGGVKISYRYQEAFDAYQEALNLFRALGMRQQEGITLRNIGVIYQRTNDYRQALEYFEQSLDISREVGSPENQVSALLSLGSVYWNLATAVERTDDALQESVLIAAEELKVAAENMLLEALELLDSLREGELSDVDKRALFETQRDSYIRLQTNLLSQGRVEEALVASERARTRVLVEALVTQAVTSSTEQFFSDRRPQIDEIRRVAQQRNMTLVSYSILDAFDAGTSNPMLYIWVVQPSGNIEFASVELAPNLPRSELIVSETGEITSHRLPSEGISLKELVTNTRQSIGIWGDRAGAPPTIAPADLAQLQAEAGENLSQLHKLLIEPIAALLPTDPHQKVAFIPQGELFLVPFPALKDANGEYLIENHTILTAPSIQVLQLTQELAGGDRANGHSPLQGENPLIVGDPFMPEVTFLSEAGNFESVQLQPLYGARQEAQAVAGFLNTAALVGEQATEAQIKRQIAEADLIHLATHGLLEYGDPRQTGSRDTPGAVALAPGNGEDGLLTSTEILQMELQADLVVLSACDTGRGRITGDGVIGLSRSFIAAGVPSIIVSLWAVPDAPTADLMTEFYNQLSQGQTKAQALRQAMLITMETHPDPKDWAAFTLIGDAE